MRKLIENPYPKLKGYNCFGCAPQNPIGLHLTFFEEDDFVISEWQPSINYQGFVNVLHGGIQSALLDEIASWTIWAKLKVSGVTSKLNLQFKKNVRIDEGPILIKGKVGEIRRNLVNINVFLYDAHGDLCAEGTALYYTVSRGKATEMGLLPEEE